MESVHQRTVRCGAFGNGEGCRLVLGRGVCQMPPRPDLEPRLSRLRLGRAAQGTSHPVRSPAFPQPPHCPAGVCQTVGPVVALGCGGRVRSGCAVLLRHRVRSHPDCQQHHGGKNRRLRARYSCCCCSSSSRRRMAHVAVLLGGSPCVRVSSCLSESIADRLQGHRILLEQKSHRPGQAAAQGGGYPPRNMNMRRIEYTVYSIRRIYRYAPFS